MRIDAHQHFWKFDPARDSWIDDSMQRIRNDFLPSDLAPLLSDSGIEGCVAIQADQSRTETEFLLKLAEEHSLIKGVVGWVDLMAPDLDERLNHYSGIKSLKGFRHILQGESDDFFTNPTLIRGISKLASFNFSYDLLLFEPQLPVCIELVKQLPEMSLVVDHIAKPDIKKSSFDMWAHGIKKLSDFPHVHVKLSGMVTEADWNQWKSEEFSRYLDHCMECFGADRLMFGSDWPVCLLAAEYSEVVGIIEEYISSLSDSEQSAIMGETAVQFYNL